MYTPRKLENANVVVVFDSQDEADEALMGLRIAGFPDRRIGYFSRLLNGLVVDLAGPGYTVTGVVLGVVVGAGLGLWLGWLGLTGQGTPLAPPIMPEASTPVVLFTSALWGAALLSLLGGAIGWCVHRREVVHIGSEMEPGRFVLAVDAGDRKDEACAILCSYGGRNPQPADHVVVGPAVQGTATA